MKVTFTDVDQQSVNGRTARAVNRSTGEVHTVTIAGGEADFGQLTYQQAYEVYGVTASGARVTQVMVKTETSQPSGPPQSAPSLSATAGSDTRINLTIGSVSGATGYEYRVDGGTPVDVGTNRTPQVTGLTAETQYSFEARAYNAEGAGPWSSVVQATTQAVGAGVVLTESFDKADGPGIAHDLSWSFVEGDPQDANTINGVAHFPFPSVRYMIRAEHDLSSANQYAEIHVIEHDDELPPEDSGVNVAICVRGRSDQNTACYLNISSSTSNTFRIMTVDDGSTGTLKMVASTPPSVPYTARVEVEEVGGGDMVVRGYIDSVEVISYQGPSLFSDARRPFIRVTGGRLSSEIRNVGIDNFEAGDL